MAAPRINVTEREELYRLRKQVRLAREIMEVNDPLNARDIFGPPEMEAPSQSIEEAIIQAATDAPDRAEDVYA